MYLFILGVIVGWGSIIVWQEILRPFLSTVSKAIRKRKPKIKKVLRLLVLISIAILIGVLLYYLDKDMV